MKKVFIILSLVIIVVISSRKKNGGDTVNSQTIHGQMYNFCTDSRLVNCTVFLKENSNTITLRKRLPIFITLFKRRFANMYNK